MLVYVLSTSKCCVCIGDFKGGQGGTGSPAQKEVMKNLNETLQHTLVVLN